ncbi:hypothetical protein [Pelagicoccus sp. SDUM812003]|uniref:hypothetical protein n=1 Tax=Pelagicoccus sp. SDUM812003 TaxID=3041267 RepID=UPI0028102996|nr:hypothetical protein [Pelagicoccus sp. SDUM812003]MDQ8204932.1 hypothetical protein [Pelagicoccus sp. SDUM812003]
MRTVNSFTKSEDAHLFASMLEGNGLHPNVRDDNMSSVQWLYTQAVGGVKVEVPDSEYEQAIELMNLPRAEESSFSCPHCGSSDVALRQLSGITALFIILGTLLVPVVSRKADCRACRRSFKVRQSEKGIETE